MVKRSNSQAELAQLIDHTLLKADATTRELERLCDEAKKWHFATVCVNSCHVSFMAKKLEGSDVSPIAVVGFPLGAASSGSKAFEAQKAVHDGAREIDMVINMGALKSKDYETVVKDVAQVVQASQPAGVKVILETALLSDEEKIIACALAKAGGAAFVKTSTGFSSGGAKVEDVALMRRIVGDDMGVKASGGIKTLADAQAMIDAGANRLGCSSSVEIISSKELV